MTKPYLTKVWIGRHWWYIDTDRKWKSKNFRFVRRWAGAVSYRKATDA
jgi:hypothetical protein